MAESRSMLLGMTAGLLIVVSLALAGCDQADSGDVTTPAAGDTAAVGPAAPAPDPIPTMALSELERWRITGYDESTQSQFENVVGVKVIDADAEAQTVLFKWSPKHTDKVALQQALEAVGQTATPVEPVEGQVALVMEAPKIHCGGCVEGVRSKVAELEGVELDRISVADLRIGVRFDPEVTDPEAVLKAINDAGFVATVAE